MMKAFIFCVALLNVASGYLYGGNNNYGGYGQGTYPGYYGTGTNGQGTYGTGGYGQGTYGTGGYGQGTYGTGGYGQGTYGTGTYGQGTYGTGYGGTYGRYPAVGGKREAPTQATADVSLLFDAIQSLLQQAKDPKGIPASQIKSSSLVIKSMSLALLKEDKSEILEEDVNKLIIEIAANFSALSVVDILNSGIATSIDADLKTNVSPVVDINFICINPDPLNDEAYRVTVILRMLRECAERIKILHANGNSYGHVLKAVFRLAVRLIRTTDSVVDLIKVETNYQDGNKRGLSRRQGPWQFGGGLTWDEDTGYRGGFNAGYKDENVNASSSAFYDEDKGRWGFMGTFNWG